jgi:hypothetical protein
MVDAIINESGAYTLILGIGAKVIPFKPLHYSMWSIVNLYWCLKIIGWQLEKVTHDT